MESEVNYHFQSHSIGDFEVPVLASNLALDTAIAEDYT
jgi:hypothetical protein